MLTAGQMGQVGQMLSQNNFLGGLGNLEGSILIGIVSIVYSLAIAVIPFLAKRIVSGELGSTAAAMVGAAVTALTAGVAGIEGGAAGLAAARTGSTGATSAGTSAGAAGAGSARALTASSRGNLPAPPQPVPAASSATSGFGLNTGAPTLEGHANQIRNSIRDAMSANRADEPSSETMSASNQGVGSPKTNSRSGARSGISNSGSGFAQKRGPSVHRHNLGTWGAYHAARIAAGGIARGIRHKTDQE